MMEWLKKHDRCYSGLLSILIFIIFIAYVLMFVFAHGVCCGDDANLAKTAKSVAYGEYQTIRFGFDPHLMVILPVSFGIKFFGNTYWVPGFSVLLLNILIIIAIGGLLRKYNRSFWFAAVTLLFFFLNITLMSTQFEHWYAAFGEIPTGMLLILGLVLFYTQESSIFHFLSGIVFSLAFVTKVVSLVAVFGFVLSVCIIAFLQLFNAQAEGKIKLLKRIGFFILGFITPFVLFEGYRYFHLGLDGFIRRWVLNVSHVLEYSKQHLINDLIQGYVSRSRLFKDLFGIPFLTIYIVLIIAGIYIRKNKLLKLIILSIMSMVVFYSLWWLYSSIGWGRHFTVPLLLVIFAAVLPFFSSRSKEWLYAYACLLILWTTYTWKNISHPIKSLDGYYFQPTPKTQALIQVSDFISREYEGELVITKWGATISDMIYMTDEDLRYTYYRSNRQYKPPFWVAVNTKFLSEDTQDFKRFLSRCGGLQDIEGYLVGRCE